MKKIRDRVINENGGLTLPVVWALTAVILIIAFFGYKIIYMACDDYDVAGIIGGAYGDGRIRYIVPFISTVLTYPLAKLSELTGQFYTYYIFLCAALSAVFFAQHYIFYRFKAKAWYQAALLLIQIGTLVNFTFTVIAFMLSGTGLLWAYSLDKNKNNRIFEYICAALFVILGVALRRNSIYIAIAFIPLLFEIILHKKGYWLAGVFVLAAAMYVITKRIDMMVFSQSTITEYYYKYNLRRAFFLDHPKYKYINHGDKFMKAGITKNMHEAMYSALLYDKDKFGYEKLNEVASTFNIFEIYRLAPDDLLRCFLKYVIKEPSLRLYFLAGTSICILKLKNSKRALCRIEIIIAYLMPYVLFMMLIVRRRFVDRVALPMALIGVMIMMVCGTDEERLLKKWINAISSWIISRKIVVRISELFKKISPKTAGMICGALIFAAMASLAGTDILYIKDENDIKTTAARQNKVIEAYDYINAHKENLYLNLSLLNNDLNFQGIPAGKFSQRYFADNLLSRRRWMIFSDWYYETVDKYNVTDKDNLLYSSAFDDNVFILAEPGKMLTHYANYMHDAYDIDVKLEVVEYFDQHNVIFSAKAVK